MLQGQRVSLSPNLDDLRAQTRVTHAQFHLAFNLCLCQLLQHAQLDFRGYSRYNGVGWGSEPSTMPQTLWNMLKLIPSSERRLHQRYPPWFYILNLPISNLLGTITTPEVDATLAMAACRKMKMRSEHQEKRTQEHFLGLKLLVWETKSVLLMMETFLTSGEFNSIVPTRKV